MKDSTQSVALQFLGAAGTVTGSRHLLRSRGRAVLLDCGLFQGLKPLRLRNWAPLPVNPRDIAAIVLSHAHIDHSGYLPLLARSGFAGPVYCTAATADLLAILLPDSGHLQEEDAERANRRHYTRHHPALPLYTREDAIRSLRLIERRPWHESFAVADGMTATFRRAGHILGAATVDLDVGGCRLVYTGDLGRPHSPLVHPPEPVSAADVLLVESTYGQRHHVNTGLDALEDIVRRVAARGGTLVIPAFSVGRTQELVWMLRKLEQESRIPVLPVYLDSPMSIDVTELYLRHAAELTVDPALLRDRAQTPLRTQNFHLARTPDESRAINDLQGPVIIISASGMATGGRILHHLHRRLPDPRATVLLPGFQAAGTRGRSLQDGAKELRMFGEQVPVRATVVTLDGLSAHADASETLAWLSGFSAPPRQTYVVHGEPEAAAALVAAIQERLGWRARVAVDQETVTLT